MKKNHHYTYRFGFGQFANLTTGLGLLGGSILLLVQFNIDNTIIVIASLLIVIGLIPILLTANYLAKSREIEIRISSDNDQFEIVRKGTKQTRKIADIMSLEIQEQRSIGLYGSDFNFARYTFVDRKQCIVTNMMTNNYYVPAGLQPKISLTIFPIIWGRTNV